VALDDFMSTVPAWILDVSNQSDTSLVKLSIWVSTFVLLRKYISVVPWQRKSVCGFQAQSFAWEKHERVSPMDTLFLLTVDKNHVNDELLELRTTAGLAESHACGGGV